MSPAARCGAAVWLAYAVVELGFSTFVPSLLHARIVVPMHLGFTLAVLALYPAAGAVLTAAVARLWGPAPSWRAAHAGWLLSSCALATVILSVAANALFSGQFALAAPGLALASVLTVARWRGAFQLRVGGVHAALCHPWTVCLLLVGVTYAREPRALSAWSPGLLAVVYAAAVAAGAVAFRLVQRLLQAHRTFAAAGARLLSPVTAALVLAAATAWIGHAAETPWSAPSPSTGSPHPNVVLISLDTVRADHLSSYGYTRDTSPNLTELARTSTLFTHAFSASNETLASHASMFTGLDPRHHGAVPFLGGQMTAIRQEVPTLPELLAARGYWTVGIVANAGRLAPELGFGRGFASYDVRPASTPLTVTKDYFLQQPLKDALGALLRNESDAVRYARSAASVTHGAQRVLADAAAARTPLFLFINYLDAHWPSAPPVPFDRKYPGKLPKYDWRTPAEYPVPAEELVHLVSQYDGAIAYLDDQLGRLFAEMKRLGMFDNTLLIVTADHGEAFGEHGYLYHHNALYEEEVRVPLIVKYPADTRAAVVSHAVGAADLLPTVFDVLGEPASRGLDGRSLRHADPSRMVVSEAYLTRPNDPLVVGFALSTEDVRVIQMPGRSPELYDRRADPLETVNIWDRLPNAEWSARLGALKRERPQLGEGVSSSGLQQQLRALGYIR